MCIAKITGKVFEEKYHLFDKFLTFGIKILLCIKFC